MIEQIDAFLADIDGTLAPKGEDLMPKTRKALQKLHEQGVKVGIATGRPLDYRTLDHAKNWNLGFEFDCAIGMNGGDLWIQGDSDIWHFHLLQPETIREILTMLQGLDVNAIIYENGYDHVIALRWDEFLEMSQKRNNSVIEIGDIDRLSKNPTGKIEVHYNPDDKEEIYKRINEHLSDHFSHVETFPGTVEFQDPRVNKGLGLREYAKRAGIDPEHIIGFGDMENDIGLLKDAGWGVCLKNGSDETKAAADDITEFTVEEDGVGNYLEKNWFKEPLL